MHKIFVNICTAQNAAVFLLMTLHNVDKRFTDVIDRDDVIGNKIIKTRLMIAVNFCFAIYTKTSATHHYRIIVTKQWFFQLNYTS